jgi:hypothetical protein
MALVKNSNTQSKKVTVPLTFEKADQFNLALYFAGEIHNGGAFEISEPGRTIVIS